MNHLLYDKTAFVIIIVFDFEGFILSQCLMTVGNFFSSVFSLDVANSQYFPFSFHISFFVY